MVNRQKILIVDDKQKNLFALEKILAPIGAEIVKASSGNEALKLSLSNEFALAILDVQMPEMDGYELAELLQSEESTASLPIIFLTAAHLEEQHIFKGYKYGAVDYITKPFNSEILESKVRIFLQLNQQKIELERLNKSNLLKYQIVFSTVSDAILLFDVETDRFLDVNAAALEMYDYSREEFLGMKYDEITNKVNGSEIAFKHLESIVQADDPVRWHKKKGGVVFPVEISGSKFEWNERTVICIVVRDITDRKKLEDAQVFLAQCGCPGQGEDFFEDLAIYLAGSLEMDSVRIDRLCDDNLTARTVAVYYDGRIDNNFEHALKDTPCVDLLEKQICCYPKGVRHLFPKDLLLQKIHAESYVGTTLYGFDGIPIGLIAAIGQKPLADSNLAESILKLVAVRAAGELERKRANEQLIEREAMLNKSQEIAHLGSWELDLSTNRLLWSDEVFRIFGLDPQVFIPTYESFLKAVHPEDREAVENAYTDSLRERRDSYDVEHRVVRNNSGEIRYVHERCNHIKDSYGNIVRSVGMVLDRTERKKIEAEIQTLMKNLIEKNTDLEAFTYTISHDLKSPLITIEGFASALIEDNANDLGVEGKRYLSRIIAASKKMSNLITALLNYSRVDKSNNKHTEAKFDRMVSEALSYQTAKIRERGITVIHHEAPVNLYGDIIHISQIFDNLISNAIKYIGDLNEAPVIEIGAFVQGRETICYVRDNGPGILPEFHEKIFGVFQRLPQAKNKEGTGIGLSIVNRIVDAHGGRVWLESAPGQGSTFFFSLPMAESE